MASVVCIVYTYTWCVHCIEVTWPLYTIQCIVMYRSHVTSATALSFRSRRRCCCCCCAICPRCHCVFSVHTGHTASDKVPSVQSFYALHKILLLCCIFSVIFPTGEYSHNTKSARNFRSRLSRTNSRRGGWRPISSSGGGGKNNSRTINHHLGG